MKKTIITIMSLVTATLLVGCRAGSKITKDNFDKVKEGMTKVEVVAILGEPTGSELVGQISEQKVKGPVWEGQGFGREVILPPDSHQGLDAAMRHSADG